MVPGKENEGAGSLFDMSFCRYRQSNALGFPPASTGSSAFHQLIHGPNRDTEVWTRDVTTTLATVSIRFDAYPNDPDFGLTANPCWPSTLVDDPGFALLISDGWYANAGNAQRSQMATMYSNPPPLAITQNNPPRAGYEKRFLDHLDKGLKLHEGFTAQALEDYLAALGISTFRTANDVGQLKEMAITSICSLPPKGFSAPRASEAGPTSADTHSESGATSATAMVGGTAKVAPDPIPTQTGAVTRKFSFCG